MKLIAGLGNPGSEYAHTRHNIGFEVIDALAEATRIPVKRSKFDALYGKGVIQGEDVLLVKPLTYMNLSGEAIAPIMSYYKVSIDDLLVVYDDLDLPIGNMRMRMKGSAGGHNGMKSIISHIGTQDFKRLRVGIGRPEGRQPVIDYVLRRFSSDEQPDIDEVIEKSVSACEKWFGHTFVEVMNTYNG